MAYLPARCLADAGLAGRSRCTPTSGAACRLDYSTAGATACRPRAVAPPPKLAGSIVRVHRVPVHGAGEVLARARARPGRPTDSRARRSATKQRQEEHRRKESGEPREKGKKPVKEKTFWEKNWMYIVPISFLVSNALSAPPQKAKRG